MSKSVEAPAKYSVAVGQCGHILDTKSLEIVSNDEGDEVDGYCSKCQCRTPGRFKRWTGASRSTAP
jgi:hypothetical protein